MNPSKYEQLSEQITQKQNQEGFIKVTDSPVKTLTPKQKVILNRKANVLFNEGNIEGARRIYITTGYSDGLIRVGDIYKDQKKPLKALKFYYLAHNKAKCEELYEKIASVISELIKTNDYKPGESQNGSR